MRTIQPIPPPQQQQQQQRGNLFGNGRRSSSFVSSRRTTTAGGIAAVAAVAVPVAVRTEKEDDDGENPPLSPNENDPRPAVDREAKNHETDSMEEITNRSVMGATTSRKTQPSETATNNNKTTTTSQVVTMENTAAPTQPRSFGHELKGHSNVAETAAALAATTTASEQESTYHSPDESMQKERTVVQGKRMSMMTTTSTKTSASHAPTVNRRMSLSTSYRRPGNVAKPPTSAVTGVPMTASRSTGTPKTPFLMRSHLTPVRISTKVVEDTEVQATNDGYASVAKLSAWLADDPTKAKQRVKQIRRGANVIAKSRKFDKELANVKIIEADTLCPRGRVREKQHWLIEQQHLGSGCDDDAASVTAASHRTASSYTGGLETSSAVSVQDKKEWLANAFQPKGRAKTDVGAHEDDVEDVTSRAKQMWRQRATNSSSAGALSPPPRTLDSNPQDSSKSSAADRPTELTTTAASGIDNGEASRPVQEASASVAVTLSITSIEFDTAPSSKSNEEYTDRDLDDAMSLLSLDHPSKDAPEKETSGTVPVASAQKQMFPRSPPPSTPQMLAPSSVERSEPSPAQSARLRELQQIRSSAVVRKTADVFVRKDPEPEPVQEESDEDKVLSFQAARELLINRSKQNGNAVEVLSKVGRRKAIFEKMQKDNHRKSLGHGHLKPSWKPDESYAVGGAKTVNKYKKTFVSDAAPKKSFEDLP